MKIYLTKYALTKGIISAKAEAVEGSPKLIAIPSEDGQHRDYFRGKDWHLTKKAAVARAEEMRLKQIAKLQSQIKVLTELQFTV